MCSTFIYVHQNIVEFSAVWHFLVHQVSYWVASEICCVEDARLRGILIEKFIEVAKVSLLVSCICNVCTCMYTCMHVEMTY